MISLKLYSDFASFSILRQWFIRSACHLLSRTTLYKIVALTEVSWKVFGYLLNTFCTFIMIAHDYCFKFVGALQWEVILAISHKLVLLLKFENWFSTNSITWNTVIFTKACESIQFTLFVFGDRTLDCIAVLHCSRIYTVSANIARMMLICHSNVKDVPFSDRVRLRCPRPHFTSPNAHSVPPKSINRLIDVDRIGASSGFVWWIQVLRTINTWMQSPLQIISMAFTRN